MIQKALGILLFLFLGITIFPNYMGIEEIKQGMKGTGFSVIEGEKIEPFDAEILKVVRGQGSIKDMILVKLSGDLIKRSGGISEGMSGSPIYVNDKLLGALSFTIDGNNSIGLVTPINELLKLTKFDEQTIIGQPDTTVKPGMAIAITPVRGDISMDVVGTLTYVDGSKVYALGHPISSKGSMKYFLNRATIDYSINAKDIPFKMGRSLDTIGIITQDREQGLAGYLVKDIKTYKFALEVKNRIETKKCNFEMIADDYTVSQYLNDTLKTAIQKNTDSKGYKTARYYFEVYDEANVVIYKNSDIVYMDDEIVDAISEVISSDIMNIIDNPYKRVKIKRLKLKIDLSETKDIAYVRDFSISSNIFKLGDTFDLTLNYNVFRKGAFRDKLRITVPKNLKIGVYSIKIFSGSSQKGDEAEFYDFDSFLNHYKNQYKNNEVVIRLIKKDEVQSTDNIIEYRTSLNNYVVSKKTLEAEIIVDSFEASQN